MIEKSTSPTYQLNEWDSYWENRPLRSQEELTKYFDWAKSTSKFTKIIKYLNEYLDIPLANTSTIELGCGEAAYSAQFARFGANTLAIDYSNAALSRAQNIFKLLELDGNFLQVDFQHLPENLLGKFDVSFSFGTVEHYVSDERFKMIKLHHDLLKPGGIAIISVPNKYCVPYNIWLNVIRLRKIMTMPDEFPFSRAELAQKVKQSGGKLLTIVGESVIDSSREFLWRLMIGPALKKIGIKELDLSIERRWKYRDPALPLDDWLGYSLISISKKID
jgi:2-polyprenyl-3-methyl-5-hydroxy-6-metoxy-1,4-benzoquinol methylase